MYDSVPRGIIKVPISISENFHGDKQVMLYLVHSLVYLLTSVRTNEYLQWRGFSVPC